MNSNPLIDRAGNCRVCGQIPCICGIQRCEREPTRRRTDTQPAPMRSILARQLMLAAEMIERDEQRNAEMIDVLVKAGYKDIPARIDASVIKRLLGYATPRV